ncbi:helix-turn-helix domain-containing protein [uncultured Algibacter sp.]|uniref:helix-turn-helix domain-containing protein n=1 Tax=uncultured Algibacter sp. TaxID=298659 RepID=UPI0026061A9E|nr:helix-turn-helix domain-containing protein [uncultured Algibacter sp.]
MNIIGNKIKEVRNKKGMSQEDLAENAKVSLRTIQRIENNENEPRGKTLHLICEALELNAEDILDYGKQNNKNYLIYLHLSVLSFFIIPLGNIILPLIIWLTNKDKIIGLNEAGINLLNFQIFWTFITYGSLIGFVIAKIMHFKTGGLASIQILIYVWLILNTINIILPILFSVRIGRDLQKSQYPKIIKLIK